MSIKNYSSKAFLQNSANIHSTINPTSHTTLNTSTIEKENNTLLPHTSLVPITNPNPNKLRRYSSTRLSIAKPKLILESGYSVNKEMTTYQQNSINSNISYTSSDVSNIIDPE